MKKGSYAILLGLFFLSGITGLVYEVAWTRMLTLVFGHTVHAVSTVLAAFMGGLALGSFLFSRFADRARRPLVIYAVLEVGIGLFALAVPFLFGRLDELFAPLYRALEGHFVWFSVVRLAVCFGLLLLPTILMGATLPILAHAAVSESSSLGRRIGRLYAVNTLGAVAGCFLSGFVLIEALGVHGTIYAAAGLNLLVGALALLVPRAAAAEPATTSPTVVSGAPQTGTSEVRWPGALAWIYGISGFVALALEVAWTRALVFSFFVGSSTYAFTTMLTIFLLGLGSGSLAAAAVVDRLRNRLRVAAWAEIAIGLFALLSVPALVWLSGMHVRESQEISWAAGTLRDFLKSAAVMLVPTFAMGALFPLLARVTISSAAVASRGVGRLYFANTLGAILGSLGAGFVLIPRVGLSWTVALLGCVSVALGLSLVALDLRAPARERLQTAVAAVVAAALLLVLVPSGVPFQKVAPGEALLFYEEGSAGTVAVSETPSGERRLQIDNVWIAGTNPVMRTAHKTLAHMASLIAPDPKTVLTVGFASGGTSHSFTTHPNLERIDCVEIARPILDTRGYFASINADVLADPRYRVVIEDARTFLLLGEGAYSIIATDCTDLRYKSDANLYTVEYFETCRRRLEDDGMLVVFLPFGGLTDPYLRGVLGTFRHVFPEGTVWYLNNYPTHYFLLIGSKKPLAIDWTRFRERLAEPAVATDLADVDLDDPYRLLSSFLMDAATLESFVAHARLNSVLHPWVEFGAPREVTPGLLDNLDLVLDAVDASLPPVSGMSPEERDTLARYVRASRMVLRGHVHVSRGQVEQARFEYEDALALLPRDRSLERMIGISDEQKAALEARLARDPKDSSARYELAMLLRARGSLAEAASMLRAILAEAPSDFRSSMSLAVTLAKQGRTEEALAQFAATEASARSPQEAEVARNAGDALRRKAALLAQPADTQPALDLAQAYAKQGDLYEALRFLSERVEERHEAQVALSLTYLFLEAQMVERAMEQAQALLAREPDNAAAHYYLLDAYLRRGRLDRAEQEFEASRRLDDRNASLWFMAARLYQRQGRREECTEALRKVLLYGGPDLLRLARRDPSLADSPSLAEVWAGYAGSAPGGAR